MPPSKTTGRAALTQQLATLTGELERTEHTHRALVASAGDAVAVAQSQLRRQEAALVIAKGRRDGAVGAIERQIREAVDHLFESRDPRIAAMILAIRKRMTDARERLASGVLMLGTRRLGLTTSFAIKEFIARALAAIAILDGEDVAALEGDALVARLADLDVPIPAAFQLDAVAWRFHSRGRDYVAIIREPARDGDAYVVQQFVDDEVVRRRTADTFEAAIGETDAWFEDLRLEAETRADAERFNELRRNQSKPSILRSWIGRV